VLSNLTADKEKLIKPAVEQTAGYLTRFIRGETIQIASQG
jgi:hypothetical protein